MISIVCSAWFSDWNGPGMSCLYGWLKYWQRILETSAQKSLLAVFYYGFQVSIATLSPISTSWARKAEISILRLDQFDLIYKLTSGDQVLHHEYNICIYLTWEGDLGLSAWVLRGQLVSLDDFVNAFGQNSTPLIFMFTLQISLSLILWGFN